MRIYWFAALVLLTCCFARVVRAEVDLCEAVAVTDTSVMDAPEIILRRGERMLGISQYVVMKSGHEDAFCAHGGYCYHAHVVKDGRSVEALRLTNCTVGPSWPATATDPEIAYRLDLDLLKIPPMHLKLQRTDEKLSALGLCSSCASNAAQGYVYDPQSRCGRDVGAALAGSGSALDRLSSGTSRCAFMLDHPGWLDPEATWQAACIPSDVTEDEARALALRAAALEAPNMELAAELAPATGPDDAWTFRVFFPNATTPSNLAEWISVNRKTAALSNPVLDDRSIVPPRLENEQRSLSRKHCQPNSAMAQSAPPATVRPSRPAEAGCAWVPFTSVKLGVRMLVQDCPDPSLHYVFSIKGKWIEQHRPSDDRTFVGAQAVMVLSKPVDMTIEQAVLRFTAKTIPKDARGRCAVVPLPNSPVHAGQKITLTLVPTGSYAALISAELKQGPRDFGCGEYGMGQGLSYFKYHPEENRGKFLFVVYGQEEPLFDEQSLQISP